LPEGGVLWEPVDTATIHVSVVFYEFHDTLYIGSGEGCHYFNPDESTWVPRNSGFRFKGIYSFTSWNDTLYSSSYPGIYKMNQNGSWNLWNSELSWLRIETINAYKNDVWVKSIWDNPYGPYGYQLFKSSDNGANFTELDSNLVLSGRNFIMTDSLYYVTTKDGFFVSEDFGESWEPHNNGLDTLEFYSTAINQQHCYAGTPKGLYWSSNPPGNWEPVPSFIGTRSTGDVTVNDSIIICRAILNDSTSSIMRSGNSGVSFDPICIDVECNTDFYPYFEKPNFYCRRWDSVYYSPVLGLVWINIPTPWFYPPAVTFEADENCLVMAGGLFEFVGRITYDMGNEWFNIYEGLQPPPDDNSPISTHEINEKRIFTAMAYRGLWYRDDLLTQIKEEEKEGPGAIQNWPNPFTNEFSIAVNSSDLINGQLRIFDIWGRMIFQEELHSFSPIHLFRNAINTPGLYVLLLQTGDHIYSAKLVRK